MDSGIHDGSGVVQSHETVFTSIWMKRGYSEMCVARMLELNLAGVNDPEMLETVKKEGLV